MPVASLQASTVAPSLLEFPSDGSLLMPEVPDSDEEDDEPAIDNENDLQSAKPNKRKRASSSLTPSAKRTRRTRNSIDSPTKIPRNRSPSRRKPSE